MACAALAVAAAATVLQGCGGSDVIAGAGGLDARPAPTPVSVPARPPAGVDWATPTPAPTTPEGNARVGLEPWTDFSVEAERRPVVLIGGQRHDAHFDDDRLAEAYRQGRWEVRAELPETPERYRGWPVIDAEEALRRWEPAITEPWSEQEARVRLTGVRLGSASFFTDRGEQQLPAWLLTFADSDTDAAVFALKPPGTFDAPTGDGRARGADVEGTEITVHFVGGVATEGPCATHYGLQIAESDQAVSVYVHELAPDRAAGRPGDKGTKCILAARSRTLTGELDAPLGDRVVVAGPGGEAIPVLPGGYDPRWMRP